MKIKDMMTEQNIQDGRYTGIPVEISKADAFVRNHNITIDLLNDLKECISELCPDSMDVIETIMDGIYGNLTNNAKILGFNCNRDENIDNDARIIKE